MLSRKKRNIKYYKNHPTSKRPRLSTIEPNSNVEAGEPSIIEKPSDEGCENEAENFLSEKGKLLRYHANTNR